MAPVLSLDMGRDPFKAFLTDVVGISSDVAGDFCIKQVQCSAKSTGSLWKEWRPLSEWRPFAERRITTQFPAVRMETVSTPRSESSKRMRRAGGK